jgi:hypothetical protein
MPQSLKKKNYHIPKINGPPKIDAAIEPLEAQNAKTALLAYKTFPVEYLLAPVKTTA